MTHASLVYRYVPPEQVVARAVTYIGDVLLEFSLRFSGSLTVTCSPDEADEPPEARATLQLAGTTLHRITDRLFVSTVSPDQPRICSTTLGHRFTHASASVAGPRTRRFSGQCRVELGSGRSDEPAISGSLGYALDVRAVAPSDPPGEAPPGWSERHDESFASIGGVVLEEVDVPAGRGALLIAG